MDSKLAVQIGLAFGLFVFGGIFFKMASDGQIVMGLIGGGMIGAVVGLMALGLLSPLIKKEPSNSSNKNQAYRDNSNQEEDFVVTEKAILSAENGNVKAQVLVGVGYLSGSHGLPQNTEKAAKFMLSAALQGDAYAAFIIAGLYFDGSGIEKSIDKARVWANKSKTLGYPDAEEMIRAIDEGEST
jgi:TPR repeat protein